MIGRLAYSSCQKNLYFNVYFKSNVIKITFDLKSGYHHLDIHPDSHKCLGFSWNINGYTRFFEFTVLPFGLSPAPYIFTKVLKPLITHWRSCGIMVAVYLDDGFISVPATGTDIANALQISKHVRVDLMRAGFVYNIEKSKWHPCASTEWLGMEWDT